MQNYLNEKITQFSTLQNKKLKNIYAVLGQMSAFCESALIESTNSEKEGYTHLTQSIITLNNFIKQNQLLLKKDANDIQFLKDLIADYEKKLALEAEIKKNPEYTENPNKNRNPGEHPVKLSEVRNIKKELDS